MSTSRSPRRRGAGSITSYPVADGRRWRFEITAPVDPANSKHAGRPKGEKAKRVKPFSIWNVDELT